MNKSVQHETGVITEELHNVSLVIAELKRAEAKYSWEGNSLERNALILSEEAGEVSRAVLRYLEEGAPVSEIRE